MQTTLTAIDIRMRSLVTRIEATPLPIEEKNEIYRIIRDQVHEAAVAVVATYMDPEKLRDFEANPEAVSVEGYLEFLDQAMSAPSIPDELNRELTATLLSIEATLKKEGILPAV